MLGPADVKSPNLDSVGHKQTFFRVRFETACNQHVEHLLDVLKVLNRIAAMHHDVVNVAFRAAHQSIFLQLLQHDAAKDGGELS